MKSLRGFCPESLPLSDITRLRYEDRADAQGTILDKAREGINVENAENRIDTRKQ